MAAASSGFRDGAGHKMEIATRPAAAASAHPARRSGIADAGAGIETGRMNASSNDVEAPASTELITPANNTANATTVIETAASSVDRDARVPRQTSSAPATASDAWASSRSRNSPPKSTSTNIANDPKAANVATAGLPITLSPNANIAGMTTAARAARRRARKPGS